MNIVFLNSLSVFFVCAGIIIAMALANNLMRNKQSMKIMNAVWILTGLWSSLIAIPAYLKFGISGNGMMDMHRPRWQSVALSTLHCGAGCTLADITGEWFTYFVPVSIGGSVIAGGWILDFILALIFGVFFQYFAIREMEDISFKEAITRAFKADFFSLMAWQIGMYGWMAIVYFVLFKDNPLEKTSWIFWFMMQLAMFFGFLIGYPMNALLMRIGIKKGM